MTFPSRRMLAVTRRSVPASAMFLVETLSRSAEIHMVWFDVCIPLTSSEAAGEDKPRALGDARGGGYARGSFVVRLGPRPALLRDPVEAREGARGRGKHGVHLAQVGHGRGCEGGHRHVGHGLAPPMEGAVVDLGRDARHEADGAHHVASTV